MAASDLRENFDHEQLDARLEWHCEPSHWMIDREQRVLCVEPDAPTDFWQRTHNVQSADSGHFLGLEVNGDFVMTTHVSFEPVHRYDQAGLMVRVSPECWLKTSVEFEPDGASALGAVVTNFGYSDWSTQAFAPGAGEVWLRVRREGDDYIVDSSADGHAWHQIRMAQLHEGRGRAVVCGLYACSPKGAGFSAEFSRLTIKAGRI
ncbi:MAG: DUF1349 domain-containing protein [Bryobacterales bacterium]|nr:DUF1349 domain-containing protein [Bryobacterales bacterium]